jgi:hypothetical protein
MRSLRHLLIGLTALAALAGPVDFGRQEYQRALAEKKLPQQRFRIQTEVSNDSPEAFRIVGSRVSGGDVRGLMYGLLEAADQIRSRSRLAAVKASAAIGIRGVRLPVHAEDLETEWFSSTTYWNEIFATLARSRFNRLNLVFGQGAVLGPRAAAAIRTIAKTALNYSVDLAISIESAAIGPDASEMRGMLANSPAIRSVQWLTGSPEDPPASFPDALLGAVARAGRRVTLEVPSEEAVPGLVAKFTARTVPWRSTEKYAPGSAKASHAADSEVVWTIPAANQEDRTNPGFARAVVADMARLDAAGLEIDGPLPVTSEANQRFYLLWGRLSYDPKTPDSVWGGGVAKKP